MRVTRAALRAHIPDEPDAISIHEDKDAGTSQGEDIQHGNNDARPVLRDITDDNSTSTEEITELKQSTKEGGRNGPKKRRGRGKKDKQDFEPVLTENMIDQSPTDNGGGEQQPEQTHVDLIPSETLAPAPLLPQFLSETKSLSQTPERPITTTSKTPKFDPELHVPTLEPPNTQDQDDSFVESIKTRSPIKQSREKSVDSFVESIKSCSPARRASRIEDSVEAMDAFEDAIEEVSTKLPQIEHIEIESPVKSRQGPPKTHPPSARKTAFETKDSKTPKLIKTSPTKNKTPQIKPAPPRTNSGRVATVRPTAARNTINKSTSRPSTVAPKPKVTTEAPKATVSFSNSPLKTQPNLAKKRVTSGALSTSKPAFVPVKSSKPPTKSSFALPGEAYQAKMKAQREERAKQEEDKTKKTFKARPAPSMETRPSMAPRENKASLARKSSAPNATGQGDDKENVTPKAHRKPRPSVMPGATSNKLDVKKTRNEGSTIRANSSVRRTTSATSLANGIKKSSPAARPSTTSKPLPRPRPSFAPRVASLTKSVKTAPSISASEASQQQLPVKVSGREVYGRTKMERERMEKENKEKEDAAKKARAEAAERGRLASREWAEKQRIKAAREKAAASAAAAAGVGEEAVAVEGP